jgi:HEAT repeat protein
MDPQAKDPKGKGAPLKEPEAQLPEIKSLDELRELLGQGKLSPEDLRKLLGHPLAVIRSEIADALAARNDFDPIVDVLRDPEPTLRVHAVRLLARAKDKEAGFRFIRALRHLDPDVRQAAFEEVLKWKGAGRGKLLLIAMDDRDPRRRRVALEELKSLEAIMRGLRDSALSDRAEQFLAEVTNERLVAALGGDEDGAARVLLQRRGPAAIPLIVPKLESEKEGASALDLLFDLSKDAAKITVEAWPRMAASARAHGVDRVPELARQAAHDADPRVRRVAVRILLRKGEWEASWIEYLAGKAGTDGWVEWDLVLVVRNVAKGTEGTPELLEAAKGIYPLVRRESAQALRKRRAVEELASLADSDDSWVVREAAILLGEGKDRRAVIPLIRTTREARGPVARQARDMLKLYPETGTFDFILEALRHKRGSVRLWGAERLEGIEDPRAIEPLLNLLGDKSSEIQFAAIRALAKFAAEDRVTARLIECLEFGDLSVRQGAIEVLGEAKAKSAVPALIRVLANTFLKVKASAALKQIGDRKGFLAVLRRKRRDEMVAKERERIKKMNVRRA